MFRVFPLLQKRRRSQAAPSPSQPLTPLPVSASPAREQLLREAEEYLRIAYAEDEKPGRLSDRLRAVREEIERTGSYCQTLDELTCGARVAWRNSARCIGRLHWNALEVRDMRHLSAAEEVFQAVLEHLRLATNGGKIRPMVTVFAASRPGQAGIRIWNAQVIRYAGYRQSSGEILGDPAQAAFTSLVRRMGWKGGPGTAFDLLPVVIQMPGQAPRLFELPPELVLEVPLSHPDFPWFAELGLKWHALPLISDMRLEIGGISYTAAPFNGWYMGTEIGARNLGDSERYNLLPVIARQMGLDTRHDRSLWKDRALVELNVAVLSSFTQQHVTMVDHHTASRQFLVYHEREQASGRAVSAHWPWLVPPISGSASPLFHVTTYRNLALKPNYFRQPRPWPELEETPVPACPGERASALATCPLV